MIMENRNDPASLLSDYAVIIGLPVQWGDQDAFGHVNNVVYHRWFESARIAYFRRIGLMAGRDGRKVGPILAASSCNYRRPIVFPDSVHVGVRATRIGRTSLGLEHRIVSEAQGVVAAEGDSTAVFFDYAASRPHPVPDEVREAVQELEGRAF
jgi:acyl-CoA thioester hydrolase